MKNKNTTEKYMTLYMSFGMCFGVSGGIIFGTIFFPDNMSLGICFGLPLGMCIGLLIGQAKDKRLSENIMIIRKIEAAKDSSDLVIYVSDKNEIEKQYRVTEKKIKEEKFVQGDRVAEEIDGSLVSLESK
ncbi:hypothetical protein ACPWSR_04690 [Alloiococcus sp. CFN-8]|uniref:hypothetical protein n=1 Tax=Alloiococcus sp. CFN-8 TaxID=3416081 RepID=UPI003CEBB77A